MKTTFLYGLQTRRYYVYTPGLSMLAGCMWDCLSLNAQRGLDLAMVDQCLDDASMDMTLLSGPAERTEPGADLQAELVALVQNPMQRVQQDLDAKFRKDSTLNRTASGQDQVPKGILIFKDKARFLRNDHTGSANHPVSHSTELARKKAIASQYANDKIDIRLAKTNQDLTKERIAIFKDKEALCAFISYHNIRPNHLLARSTELERKKEIVSKYTNELPDTRLEKVNQTLAKKRIPTFKHKESLSSFIRYHNIQSKQLVSRPTELARKKAIVSQYANELPDTRLAKINQALAKKRIVIFKNKKALHNFIKYHKIQSKQLISSPTELARKKEIVSQYANELPDTRLAKINQALAKKRIVIFKNKEALHCFILRHKIQLNYLLVRFKELERRKEIVSQYANELPKTRLETINQALTKEGVPTFKNKEALRRFMLRHKIQPNHFLVHYKELAIKKEIISQYINELPNTRLSQTNQTLAQEGIPTFKNKEALHRFMLRHKILHPKEIAIKKEIISQYANELPKTRLETINQALAKKGIAILKNKKALRNFMLRHKIHRPGFLSALQN